MQFGRFLDNPKVTVKGLIEGWGEQAAVSAVGRGHVLAIQDTTEIKFATTPEDRRGLGKVKKGRAHGVLAHVMLAIDAESGDSLGLVSGEIWTRKGDRQIPHRQRAAEDRESQRWVSTALAGKRVLSAARMVTVIGDRESDTYGSWAAVPGGNVHLLSRAMKDRALLDGGLLDATVAAFEMVDSRSVEVIERAGRKARTVRLALRFGEVTIKRPNGWDSSLPEGLTLRVVDVREVNPPPHVKPLRWCLLTTHAVQGAADAWMIVDWYKQRWVIEQLFRTLKTKGLKLEDSQIETAERLLKLTAIALRAAALIMQLVQARDGKRVLPARNAFTALEIAALEAIETQEYAPRTEKQRNPHPKRSMAWATWIIARLGGWDGYASTKPGPITIANGLDYFQGIAAGWALRNV